MDDTTYHSLADATLTRIADALEDAYSNGSLDDLDHAGSVLTITTAQGTTFVVSKHAPTQQIWLASPRSGGLHFLPAEGNWKLPDGRDLRAVLTADLAHYGVEATL